MNPPSACAPDAWRRLGVVPLGVAALAAWLVPSGAFAQPVPAIGTRALGMGGAFVAVADDASAVYWNPAGLATGPLFDLILERQEGERLPDGQGLPATGSGRGLGGTSYTVALGTPAAGLAYYRLRTLSLPPVGLPAAPRAAGSVPVSQLSTRHLGVTFLQSVGGAVSVGTTLKMVRGTVSYVSLAANGTVEDAIRTTGIDGATTTRFDLDVGVLAAIGSWRVGVAGRNLRQPEFETSGGLPGAPDVLRLKRQFRAGVAYAPRSRPTGVNGPWTVAADVDLNPVDTIVGERREAAVGAEGWWFGGWVGARGGIRWNTLTNAGQPKDPVATMGISASPARSVLLEGQISRSGNKIDENWGVSIRLTF